MNDTDQLKKKETKEDREKNNHYISDVPLLKIEGDLLNRGPFARQIAHTIASLNDPAGFVIGIYGEWGEGKTSVLNFIETELKLNPNMICIRFNPWRFPDENEMLIHFFKTLAISLNQVGEWLIKYAYEHSNAEINQQLTDLSSEDLRERIESALLKDNRRIVVLIDDIDRLNKTEIQCMFKLVKLTAAFFNTAYVLTFDDKMVEATIQENYPSGFPYAGRGFLEKMVQLPLNLPRANPFTLRKLCFEWIEQALTDSQTQLTQQQLEELKSYLIEALGNRLTTPRLCKRYGNAVSFALSILKNDVYAVDLILIEAFRLFYPELYQLIRTNKELFLNPFDTSKEQTPKDNTPNVKKGKGPVRELLENSWKEFASIEPAGLGGIEKVLTFLFPRITGGFDLFLYGTEWEKQIDGQKRLASANHFDTYFQYGHF